MTFVNYQFAESKSSHLRVDPSAEHRDVRVDTGVVGLSAAVTPRSSSDEDGIGNSSLEILDDWSTRIALASIFAALSQSGTEHSRKNSATMIFLRQDLISEDELLCCIYLEQSFKNILLLYHALDEKICKLKNLQISSKYKIYSLIRGWRIAIRIGDVGDLNAFQSV